MKWLTVKKVLEIHERSLEESGGDPGVRDQRMLESAVAQPRASFDGKDLYPGIADKAAALAFSLVMNHPFVDGNKRTGYAAMMMFLGRNGHTIITTIDERESIFVSLAAGNLAREQFLAWVRARTVRKRPGKSRGGTRRPGRRSDPPPAASS
jgi:death on curing protein